ncbi:hypothetical protein GCM10011512_29260 [Tersicoccus solisilvae]|uniref:Uncharacterized protein n=1 Tax=Tersicoccus solisilvae TaxID=1882339 RepID=A0ABQ1PPC1_9MICC|nr:hypothetical protein [Tersicoccus solisilvae]GGD00540.1 hypothetical protein GCM10011512_29260 [Tersicoccus solisilvae]
MTPKPQPAEQVAGPPTYAQPDWDGIATVTRVWVSDDETVGYLVWQNDDALAWLNVSSPDDLGYVIHELTFDALRRQAAAGDPASVAREDVLGRLLHEVDHCSNLATQFSAQPLSV